MSHFRFHQQRCSVKQNYARTDILMNKLNYTIERCL